MTTKTNKNNETYTYHIEQGLAVLATYPSGWRKELNKVSWNGNEAKYDLREWSKDHKKFSKGITLTAEELNVLLKTFA